MPFLQIRCDSGHPEFAEEILLACGALSVSQVDAADEPVLEPAPGDTPLWPRTISIGLFQPDADAAEVESQLRSVLPDGADLNLQVENVEDQDWVRVWLENCPPMKFGQRLWVCPEAKRIDEPGCATLMLDPGLAFGTGTHPSTALCLEWIANQPITDLEVIDFGCGSGILGIAALKLGARQCVAFDIDPQAIIATRENARRNEVSSGMQLVEHDAPFEAEKADVVFANILARPLIELAPLLCSKLKPGGAIVLAGLLDRQAEEVRQAYAEHLDFEADQSQEGWTRIAGRLRI